MQILKITIKDNPVDPEKLNRHRQWYKKYFDEGKFVIVGPRTDMEHAGFNICRAESRAELEEIISHDAFYPDGADYEIAEFKANLVADNISKDK